MNRRAVITVSILIVFSFFAPACSFGPVNLTLGPTPTPMPTATPMPTPTPIPTATPMPTPTPEPILGIDIPISVPEWDVTFIFDSIQFLDGKTIVGTRILEPLEGWSVAVLKGHYTGDLGNLIENGWLKKANLFYITHLAIESNIFVWETVHIENDTHDFTFGFYVLDKGPYVLHHKMEDNHWEVDLSPLVSQ